MNYDKSINSVFKQFITLHKAPFIAAITANNDVAGTTEDVLFDIPRATLQIKKHISDHDFLKKMKKAAKLQVLEY